MRFLFILFIFAGNFAQAACRDHIDDLLKRADGEPVTLAQKTRITDAYNLMPPGFQQMFCHLQSIVFNPDIPSSASTPSSTGGIIQIRQELVDLPVDFAIWMSWKDQLNFGQPLSAVEVSKTLPLVNASKSSPTLTIEFLLLEEFGRLLNIANNLNTNFSAISWANDKTPLHTFAEREDLCFFDCGKGLQLNQQDSLYTHILQSDFVTPEAALSPADDFALMFAFDIIMGQTRTSYIVETASGNLYDLMGHFKSSPMARKRAFIERFIRSPYHY